MKGCLKTRGVNLIELPEAQLDRFQSVCYIIRRVEGIQFSTGHSRTAADTSLEYSKRNQSDVKEGGKLL